MLLSPSKFLPRKFLRSLKESRYLSSGGKEYSPEEVDKLLNEKEHRLALKDYSREIRDHKNEHRELSLQQFTTEIITFQDSIFSSLKSGILNKIDSEKLSSDNAIGANTIFPLKNLSCDQINVSTATKKQHTGTFHKVPVKTAVAACGGLKAAKRPLRSRGEK